VSRRRQGWDHYQILILQAAMVLQTLQIEATELAPHLTSVDRAEHLGHLRRLLARTARDLKHRRDAYREAYGLRARLRRWWRGHTTNRSTP
jgi:hypothetical protein